MRRDIIKEQSPEEQISWIANSSHPDLTPRQKRRRTHSSSPVTSSQERNEQFAFKSIQQALRTPRTISDPATDLWTRYANGKNADGSDLKLPAFAYLMEESSPRSGPRTPNASVGGLRRWASCGMDFPASRVKRRRTNGVLRDRDMSEDREPDQPKQMSRVEMLLEKVQASLAQPACIRKDAPSSSSPLPDKGDFPHANIASPLLRSGRASQSERLSQRSNLSLQSHQSPEPDVDDEFGDDDLDIDMEQAVQVPQLQIEPAASNRQQQSTPSRSSRPPQSQPPQEEPLPPYTDQHPQPPRQQAEKRLTTIVEDLTGFGDEFGDDFGDEFGDDDLNLEDLVSAVPMFDIKSSSRTQSHIDSAVPSRSASENKNQPQTQGNTPAPRDDQEMEISTLSKPPSAALTQPEVQVDLTGFSDDEDVEDDDFGGSDLDDESFAQVEYSATQAANQASGMTSTSVRTLNLPRPQ